MCSWQIFFLNSPRNGAVNYFNYAITGNGILSVYYQLWGLQKLGDAEVR